MDFVPFISSGASSRSHYVLARKIESAPSAQAIDDILLAEIQSLVQKLGGSNMSLTSCKEYLIILLYSVTIYTTSLPDDTLNGVLPHAVNLAEAGRNVPEKRIGYLFCAEMMPARHELQLMLINTLRKDLESPHLPNICLALDHLIQCPSEDVIPAIQSRLQDLLAHNSSLVRRRVLLALKALSVHEADLMSRVRKDILRRASDSDSAVSNASLVAACGLYEICEPARTEIGDVVNELFRTTWTKNYDRRQRSTLVRLLATLRVLGLTDLSLLNQVIRRAARRKDHVLLRSAFQCIPLQAQAASPTFDTLSPITHIRFLLTSQEPNENYLFLTCLECIHPMYWAGTTPDIPTVLEQREVQHIMEFLDSPDSVLRKKTAKILNSVDPTIISSYYTNILQTLPNMMPVDARREQVCRLLEVLEVRAGADGGCYARNVLLLLDQIDDTSTPEGPILDDAIDMVLTYIRHSTETRVEISTTLLSALLELKRQLGPTSMVIMAALACENSSAISLSSLEILKGLSSRIAYCPVPVQDACLLAMLRLAADCGDVPSETLGTISKLKEASGRHIKRRCDQFIHLCSDKETLTDITRNAKSSALPDLLESLQIYQSSDTSYRSRSLPSSSRGSQSHSPSSFSSKLRYTAYDAPHPTPRLQGRSNSDYSSELGSPHNVGSLGLIAGGELALAASTAEFKSEMTAGIDCAKLAQDHERPATHEESQSNNGASRTDLIAFDSPFISDLFKTENSQILGGGSSTFEIGFDSTWEGFEAEARGWYGGSIDQLLRRMQIMDPSNVDMSVIEASLPPFLGDLKVVIKSKLLSSCAVLRLKENEEESCLWRLRGDIPLYATIKNILTEDDG